MYHAITIGHLADLLSSLMDNNNVPSTYTVAVWVPDRVGSEARDIAMMVPDIDHNEQMIAFKLATAD